ncbi:MAG: EF-hand domain-containing protein [Methylophilaceae bacterium]
MRLKSKNVVLAFATLLSTAVFSATAFSADASLTTGGYAKEFQKMTLMKMLDADGNHMVTLAEFDSFHSSVFDEVDVDKNGTLDVNEWVGKTIGKKEISVATGGYSRELRKTKMMDKMDADGDHKITKEEFLAHQQKIFSKLDQSSNQELSSQEWVAKPAFGV